MVAKTISRSRYRVYERGGYFYIHDLKYGGDLIQHSGERLQFDTRKQAEERVDKIVSSQYSPPANG